MGVFIVSCIYKCKVLYQILVMINTHTERKINMTYASEFNDISNAVKDNEALRLRIINLVDSEPILEEALEGDGRIDKFKTIILNFFAGDIGINDAIKDVEFRLPRSYSPHKNNNRVFPQGWAERLVRTSISCFYNQAVLTEIIESGQTECFVAHSSSEDFDSKCSEQLADNRHNASTLLERLVDSYRKGNWGKDVKVPDNPHCTHTVQPV